MRVAPVTLHRSSLSRRPVHRARFRFAAALNHWYEADIDALDEKDGVACPAGRTDGARSGAPFRLRPWGLLGPPDGRRPTGLRPYSDRIDPFYVFIYTIWLKRRTPQNIVIGGAAGAFPPLIGWVAATGQVDLLPLLLFGIIFLWTPPHFWALSMFVRTDYAKAGVPMLPVVAGPTVTRLQILLYTFPMAAAAISLWPLGWPVRLCVAAAALS